MLNRQAIYRFVLPIVGAVQIAALSLPVMAQNYPTRTIDVIYNNSPGSGPDVLARQESVEVAKMLGQTVIYESRPGANGRLAFQAIKSAQPDGYTLCLANDALVIAQPIADPDWNIQPGRDYEAISVLFDSPFVLAANAAMPYKDLKSFIAYAKANPNKVNFAISAGSTSEFAAERFAKTVGISVAFIPYKGGEVGLTATLGGQTDILLSTSTAKPYIDSGKLFPLVTSANERWKLFPNVPNMRESGYQYAASASYILLAPAGTPQAVLLKVNKAYEAAARLPDIMKRTDEIGHRNRSGMSPAETTAYIKSEIEVWTPIIKGAGIKLQQ